MCQGKVSDDILKNIRISNLQQKGTKILNDTDISEFALPNKYL